MLHYQLKHFPCTEQDLKRYLKLAPKAEDASLIQGMLDTIQ